MRTLRINICNKFSRDWSSRASVGPSEGHRRPSWPLFCVCHRLTTFASWKSRPSEKLAFLLHFLPSKFNACGGTRFGGIKKPLHQFSLTIEMRIDGKLDHQNGNFVFSIDKELCHRRTSIYLTILYYLILGQYHEKS